MAEKNIVNLGLVQFACSDDPAANLAKAVELSRAAAQRGAQIICLQELFRTEYFCQKEDIHLFDLAEPIPGPSTEALSEIAREHKVVIIASLFEKRAQGLYHNTAAVIDADGTLLGIYRKMHIPDDPAFYEKFYFTPGDLGFKAFTTQYARIGVLICWDQWYPEGARLTALQGADILFYPTAIGWAQGEKPNIRICQHDAWQTIQRSHAIANGVFVASVNRVGVENGLEFWGGSFVCDPFGEILKVASHDKEEIHIIPADLNEVDLTRRHWPFIRDRRIDAYQPITQRYLDT
ncbi:MAG: carbon-nitrogen hydrolase [Methylacidiphilales bacterium]|nr:carbon-nitrogen hydrolase [Candidatus Methylacidiphilales bacterium]